MKFYNIDRNIAEIQYLIYCYIKDNEDIIDYKFFSEDFLIKLVFKESVLFELSRFFHKFKNSIKIVKIALQDNTVILKCKLGQTSLKEFIEMIKKQ